MIHRPKAILFDHDGVLVDSEPLHSAAWERLIGELGLPFHSEDIRSQIGKTAPQTMARVLTLHRPGWTSEEFDLEALAARKNIYYLESASRGLQPNPGVREGLAWLKSAGIRAAVVSNAKSRELRSALDQLALSPFFDEVISRDEAGAAKPDPRPYLIAPERLGLAPAECLAVEDSPPGLEAALVGGIPAAAVMTTHDRFSLTRPVPGRPDLAPCWIGPGMEEFFAFVRTLH